MSIPAQGADGAETRTAGLTLSFDPSKLFDVVAEVGDGGAALGCRLVGIMLTGGQSSFREDVGLAFYGVSAAPALASPRADSDERTAGVLWSAWSEDDCDSDPRIDPMAQKVTEWFVGRWPIGADEPECRILIGEGRSAEIIARRIADNLTSILNTDVIRARKAATPVQPAGAVPESLRALSEVLASATAERKRTGDLYNAAARRAGRTFEDLTEVYEAFEDAISKLRDAKDALADHCLALLASHPAGQSAGSGAEEEDPREIISRLEQLLGVRGTAAVFRKSLEMARQEAAQSAPDSTRTGAAETVAVPVEPTPGMVEAGYRNSKGSGNIKGVYSAMLAARPEAPSDAGWRDISTAAPEAQGAWSFDMEAAPRDGSDVEIVNDRGQFIARFDRSWGRSYADAGWWMVSDGKDPERPLRGDEPFAWRIPTKAPAPPSSSGQGGR